MHSAALSSPARRVRPGAHRSRLASIATATGIATAVAISLGAGAPLAADDVYLHNGSVFEDVVAEVTDTHVIVELAIGRLRFPVEQVRDVVRSQSALAEFHERRGGLLQDPSSAAASWVELAAWARARGLERAWRETALFAARLDAGAPGLEPLLLEMGYERDADVGWLPRADAMRRRGLVEYRGSWMSPERASELRFADREADERAERAAADFRARSRARSDGPSDNEVALASIELAREVVRSDREEAGPQRGMPLGHAVFVGGWPWFVGGVAPASPEARRAWDALAVRQPGSIIPLETFKRQLER
jgi:hypothetical protein